MDIEMKSFWDESAQIHEQEANELKEFGLGNMKCRVSREDFNQISIEVTKKFNDLRQEGKLKRYVMFIIGRIGGEDVFEIRFHKALAHETSMEQVAIRNGIPIEKKVN